ncbi:hypothetical protein U1Q18_014598 [Sarracenia purpurea var. burkii]
MKKREVGLSTGKGGEISSSLTLQASAPKVDEYPSFQAIMDSCSVYLKITEDEQEGKERYDSDPDEGEENESHV